MSHLSARKAVTLGYTNVKVFSAGYPAWKKIVGASAKKAAVEIKAGAEEGSIDIANFNQILKNNPDSILLIDVRDAEEYQKGHFKTAINMPVDDVEKKVKTLPSTKPIVFVCNTGAQSGEAYYMVQDLRPQLKPVYYLEASCTYLKDGSYKIKPTE